jgi:hypothetical protein
VLGLTNRPLDNGRVAAPAGGVLDPAWSFRNPRHGDDAGSLLEGVPGAADELGARMPSMSRRPMLWWFPEQDDDRGDDDAGMMDQRVGIRVRRRQP